MNEDERNRIFSMAIDAAEMKRRLEQRGHHQAGAAKLPSNFAFMSSNRDALKPDNGDRRYAAIDIEVLGDQVSRRMLTAIDIEASPDNISVKLHEHKTPMPAHDDNLQLQFYAHALGVPFSEVYGDLAAKRKAWKEAMLADYGGGEPISLAQARWGGKSLREMGFALANGVDGHVTTRAFGPSLSSALFRSGHPTTFVDGKESHVPLWAVKRDWARERVHHDITPSQHLAHPRNEVKRPAFMPMAVIIHKALKGHFA